MQCGIWLAHEVTQVRPTASRHLAWAAGGDRGREGAGARRLGEFGSLESVCRNPRGRGGGFLQRLIGRCRIPGVQSSLKGPAEARDAGDRLDRVHGHRTLNIPGRDGRRSQCRQHGGPLGRPRSSIALSGHAQTRPDSNGSTDRRPTPRHVVRCLRRTPIFHSTPHRSPDPAMGVRRPQVRGQLPEGIGSSFGEHRNRFRSADVDPEIEAAPIPPRGLYRACTKLVAAGL